MGSLPGANDGVVRVEETEVNGATDTLVIPVSHTELIFSARVETNAAHFLERGHFKK
jgi:hypothetical protein